MLINTNPAGLLDLDYDALDWEYETDDYYDGSCSGSGEKSEQPRDEFIAVRKNSDVRKRKRVNGVAEKRRKRRRQDSAAAASEEKAAKTEDIPDKIEDEEGVRQAAIAELMRPSVVWKSQEKTERFPVPVVKYGEGAKVALLQDWRERLKELERHRYGTLRKAKSQVPVRQKRGKGGPGLRNGARENLDTQRWLKRRRENEHIVETAEPSASGNGLVSEEVTRNVYHFDPADEKVIDKISDGVTASHQPRKSKRLKNQ